jgi:hypothetical protein
MFDILIKEIGDDRVQPHELIVNFKCQVQESNDFYTPQRYMKFELNVMQSLYTA